MLAGGAMQAMLCVARLALAHAMRPASPLTFRPTVAPRRGFGRLYSPAVRMIVCDMERRPARTPVTMAGIAASIAILISGTWWGGALEFLMDVEFLSRERMHVGLQLTEVSSSGVAYDFCKLPGVLAAEPDREALVRCRNGHRSHQTSLIGSRETQSK